MRNWFQKFHRLLALLLAMLLVVQAVSGNGLNSSPPAANELRVTIGFVLNFAKFTQWPDTGRPPLSEFRICVIGHDSLAASVQALASGRSVRGAPVSVLKANYDEDLTLCRIAFFGPDARRATDQLRKLKSHPILTISANERFTAQGGMIELFLRQSRMRFAINQGAVKGSSLRISPELQELAIIR